MSQPPRPSRVLGRGALSAALAATVLLTAVGAAHAQSSSQSFTTVGESSFTVPTNVSSITVTAVGGAGGNAVSGGGQIVQPGGQARSVTATIPVSAGEVLYIEVGGGGGSGRGLAGGGGGGATDVRTCSVSLTVCNGGGKPPQTRPPLARGGGGGGGSGRGLAGGGGGGATDVRTCSVSLTVCNGGVNPLQTRLLVAGGGGGAGGSASGGDGGDSDEAGSGAVGSPNTAGGPGTT